MDKRLELNARQTEIVDRFCQIMEELKQENVGILLYDEGANQPEAFWKHDSDMLMFYNAKDVQCVLEPEGYLDETDMRIDCAYVDATGKNFVEPDSEEFSEDSIFFRFKEGDLPCIVLDRDFFRTPYFYVEYKDK